MEKSTNVLRKAQESEQIFQLIFFNRIESNITVSFIK